MKSFLQRHQLSPYLKIAHIHFQFSFLDKQFFYNSSFLNKWRKAAGRSKSVTPGCHYFSEISKFFETHYVTGQLFFEYRKYSSEELICRFCKLMAPVGPIPDPFPRPLPDLQTEHYKKYHESPCFTEGDKIRTADDYQPRSQLKKLFTTEEITADNTEAVKNFSKNYLVSEKLVIEYLNHLQDLKFRKDKRAKQRPKKQEVQKFVSHTTQKTKHIQKCWENLKIQKIQKKGTKTNST